MIISLVIPCMNRTYCLRQVMPSIIDAAKNSPPVEIVVLNYSSNDDLDTYLQEIKNEGENFWNFPRVSGEKFFRLAHARNAAAKASVGEYIVQLDTDMFISHSFVDHIRGLIKARRPAWMCESYIGRATVTRRDEFIMAGGYDEQFTVYGPEDKDYCARLHRRGGKFEVYPSYLITGEIQTPNDEKIRYQDTAPYENTGLWTKRAMARAMRAIYEENVRKEILVANVGREWGRYDGDEGLS